MVKIITVNNTLDFGRKPIANVIVTYNFALKKIKT